MVLTVTDYASSVETFQTLTLKIRVPYVSRVTLKQDTSTDFISFQACPCDASTSLTMRDAYQKNIYNLMPTSVITSVKMYIIEIEIV